VKLLICSGDRRKWNLECGNHRRKFKVFFGALSYLYMNMSSQEESGSSERVEFSRTRADSQRLRLQKLLQREREMKLERVQEHSTSSKELNVDRNKITFSQESISGKENESNLYEKVKKDSQVLDASGLEAISKSCTILEEGIEKKKSYEGIGEEIQENQRSCFAQLGIGYVQLWHTLGAIGEQSHGHGESRTLSCTRLDGLKVTLGDNEITRTLLGINNLNKSMEEGDENGDLSTSTNGILKSAGIS